MSIYSKKKNPSSQCRFSEKKKKQMRVDSNRVDTSELKQAQLEAAIHKSLPPHPNIVFFFSMIYFFSCGFSRISGFFIADLVAFFEK